MGTYTGFRIRGRIKPEMREIVSFVLSRWRLDRENHWLRAALEFPILSASDGFMKFATALRSDSIPGSLVGVVGGWIRGSEEKDPEWATSFDDGYLVFQLEMKNYDDEIELFVEHVVPMFLETLDHCETAPEGFTDGRLHALEDGKTVEKAPIFDRFEFENRRGDAFGVFADEPEPERWRSPWQIQKDAEI